MVIYTCIFVVGFAWSWGPLGWLVPSEIFSLKIQSTAQIINISVNIFFTFLIVQVFLHMLCLFKFGLFFFFTAFTVMMSYLYTSSYQKPKVFQLKRCRKYGNSTSTRSNLFLMIF
ncbi:hypothetical protein GIB67_022550 [Kingdonia uniflora]|uniref:Uncharacterized protein n=1 Tax=Kingdonia uniflora TaxID=39325 RepID=A0A7J7L798_9MAGN|nr:hypothetical protein GIB67_022550 [Kingdonia uniflora]